MPIQFFYKLWIKIKKLNSVNLIQLIVVELKSIRKLRLNLKLITEFKLFSNLYD